jgi:Ca-activated chloride channel family protein
LKRSDTIIYAAYVGGGIDAFSGFGRRFLSEILAYTGGTGFPVDDKAQINDAFDFFARELRHQYLIGFRPDKVDSAWHPLKVEVRAADIVGLPKSNKPPKLYARTRQGYYASETVR